MLASGSGVTIFGAQLIAHLRQSSGSYVSALHVLAGVMAVSVLLPLLVRPPQRVASRSETRVETHA